MAQGLVFGFKGFRVSYTVNMLPGPGSGSRVWCLVLGSGFSV
jgi:hypothetical protein